MRVPAQIYAVTYQLASDDARTVEVAIAYAVYCVPHQVWLGRFVAAT